MRIKAWREWTEALDEACHGVNSSRDNHYTLWG
jgi:hypothetical protein